MELPLAFAEVLAGLIGAEVSQLLHHHEIVPDLAAVPVQAGDDLDTWEHLLETRIETDESVQETEKTALIRARRGQGIFKDRVTAIESRCRITGVENLTHLIASHCKPWRDQTNEERLDGENGLLLTPSIDHLFDRGFICFEDSGTLIISPVAHKPSLAQMGIEMQRVVNVGEFQSRPTQVLRFLDWGL